MRFPLKLSHNVAATWALPPASLTLHCSFQRALSFSVRTCATLTSSGSDPATGARYQNRTGTYRLEVCRSAINLIRRKEWATITAVTQGGFKEDEEYGKSVKDIQSLTLIQSQFFDCAPLLSGILKIFAIVPSWPQSELFAFEQLNGFDHFVACINTRADCFYVSLKCRYISSDNKVF